MEPVASPPSPSPLKNMHRRYVDPGRRCKHCRWVEFTPEHWMVCGNPKCCRGQAGEGKYCCSWEREPGSDDEL